MLIAFPRLRPLNSTARLASGTFSLTGSLNTARSGHTATLLQNGNVLIAGGVNSSDAYLASAEIYNPTTGKFTLTGSMNHPRWYHAATLLQNGNVLITGGEGGPPGTDDGIQSTAEIYNPNTGTFTATGSMSWTRIFHTATLLNSGEVLVAGGQFNDYKGSTETLNTAEIYNPTTGTFTLTGSMNDARQYHSAALLLDGTVLIVGGEYGELHSLGINTTAEIYSPTAGTFTLTKGTLPSNGMTGPNALLLHDGTVLLAGGGGASNSSGYLYTPLTQTFNDLGTMAQSSGAQPVQLVGGAALLAGCNSSNTGSQVFVAGSIYPKYVVLAVSYAPPGSQSSVTYGNSTLVGTSSTQMNSFQKENGFSVSVGDGVDSLFGLTPSAQFTFTFSSKFTEEQDSTTTITVNQTTTEGIGVKGPTSSAVGLDHDYDVVWVWLNPVEFYRLPTAGQELWTAEAFDERDPVRDMDVYPIYVAYLNGDQPIPQNVAQVLARSWAPNLIDGSGPGLTSADLLSIAKADPFCELPLVR